MDTGEVEFALGASFEAQRKDRRHDWDGSDLQTVRIILATAEFAVMDRQRISTGFRADDGKPTGSAFGDGRSGRPQPFQYRLGFGINRRRHRLDADFLARVTFEPKSIKLSRSFEMANNDGIQRERAFSS